jgi:myo-inositol-1(or 4)-monophosphatase
MQTGNLTVSIKDAVKKAGELFLSSTLEKDSIIQKGHANYVTQVDYEVQKFLVKELGRLIPGSNIITEEANDNRFDLEGATWILDPIDGTTNFMHQYRQSAVSLALFMGREPVLGVIYNPYSDEMFVGEAEKGAFLNDKRISVSSNASLADCLIGFGTAPYDRDSAHSTFETAQRVFLRCQDIRRTGSAALDIAYVACGRIDGFFESVLQPWDFAAGKIILKEAGGKMTSWNGADQVVTAPCSMIATNGKIHADLLELIDG